MWGRTGWAVALAAIAAAACAAGAGAGGLPGPGALQAPEGVTTGPHGATYAAVRAGSRTRIEKRRPGSGKLLVTRTLTGRWGVPLVSYDGRTEGVSRDGAHLVIGDVGTGTRPRTQSRFAILSTRSLQVQRRIVLQGDFSFDALSPDLRTLFLIQLRADRGGLSYVVRALDLRSGRLHRHAVRDPRSHEWLMQGLPLTRATSRTGAWSYTLYAGGAHAFVHALDTVHGTAACIDLPWRGMSDATWQLRAHVSGDRLVLRRPDGTAAAVVGTRRLRVLSVARTP